MKKRKLGKSSLEVSVVGLGCNNFGALDVEASRNVVDRALESRHHAVRHRRRLRQSRRLGGAARRDPGRRAARTSCWPPSSACRWTTTAPRRGASRAYIMEAVRGEPEAAEDRLDRSLSAAPARSEDADRGDAARARRSGEAGQGPRHRLLQPAGRHQSTPPQDLAHATASRAFVTAQDEYSLLVRDVETRLMPALGSERHGLLPYFPLASGLAHRQVRAGQATCPPARASPAWAASATAT